MSEQTGRREGEVRNRSAQWLLERRHGGDPNLRKAMLPEFERFRTRVLEKARIRPGEVLLDLGTRDGLIAFGAVEYRVPRPQTRGCRESDDLESCASPRSITAKADAMGGIDPQLVEQLRPLAHVLLIQARRQLA